MELSNLDSNKIKKIADNVWLMSFPLKFLGVDVRRNVTVIRLESGRLVIHSTGPFSSADVAKIREIGDPSWIVEGMVDHDTFSKEGREAFPDLPFLAPDGFQERVKFDVKILENPPLEWSSELEVIHIDGVPKMNECVVFHRPSGTLVVCDLLFNFPNPPSLWAKILLSVGLGAHPAPGFSKRLKKAIEDKEAFRRSLKKVLALPIKRIVPGHGEVLEEDAKEKAEAKFASEKLL